MGEASRHGFPTQTDSWGFMTPRFTKKMPIFCPPTVSSERPKITSKIMIIQKYPKNTLMKYFSFNLLKISGLFPWKNPEACRHGQTDFVEFLLQCRGEG